MPAILLILFFVPTLIFAAARISTIAWLRSKAIAEFPVSFPSRHYIFQSHAVYRFAVAAASPAPNCRCPFIINARRKFHDFFTKS